ncbi:hypothetical protein HYH02_005998 [Chlamydomonas schloesseri]|uniref:FAS1 domain-containing protein n=1 Tax=Chlamydomonas schloesseri TaxID=2026947 RepID=A0A835WL34_9CHLO|nr:hypothetical protein HYH02_005998 [Chlamydomonas schloesseri]|eukprot:KAG2449253.1 hypothetical protein HYH02_005998 [Chlamydomonas schloesseri]
MLGFQPLQMRPVQAISRKPPPAAVGHGSYGGYGGYGGYDVVPQGASSSQLEAPPAIPSVVWPSLFAYLDAVVDKVIWPVLLSHTPPSMAALFKSHTSGFTLFIPQYDALAADPAVRSLMADPYHPLNAARLVDILAYHLVAGVALKASDLYDGLELVNVQGKKLLVTKPPHSDSFFLNGIELTDWVPAGEAMAIWLDGVLHDPSSGEDGSPPPAPLDRYFPAVRTALASTPGLSGTLALWDAVAADSMLGGALTALVAGPFTLLAPSDTALAAYLSAVHNNTFTTADGNNDDDDSGDGPGDGSSNGSSTSNSNSNASSHTSTTGGPATQDRGAPAAIDVGSLPPMELAAMLAPLLLTSPDTGTGFRPLAALGDGVRLATGLPAFGLPGLELQVSRHTATGMPVLAVAGVLEADGSAEEATVLAGNIYVGGGGGGAQQPQGVIHVLDRVLHSPGGGPVV